MNVAVPDFRTPDFFGLEDAWLPTADGELTHLHEAGHGVPVVLLHGSGAGVSAAANWWLNVPELSREQHTLAIDLIGFGQTIEPENAAFGIRAWGEHVLRVLDAKGIDRTWLVGNSLGGWVAFQFALDHPDRVAGIVSMGTGGAPRTKALANHARPQITPEGIRKALEDFVVDHSLVSEQLVQERFRAASRPGAGERFSRVIAARDVDRSSLPLDLNALAELDVPVLLIHGREDSVIPLSRTLELGAVLPRADIHVFSNCGHWSQVEKAREFNGVVSQFLAQHR